MDQPTSLNWLGRHPWVDRIGFALFGIGLSFFVRSGLLNTEFVRYVEADRDHRVGVALSLIPKGAGSKDDTAIAMPDCTPHPSPKPSP